MDYARARKPTLGDDRIELAERLRERWLPQLTQEILEYFTTQASTDVGAAHLLRALPGAIAAALEAWLAAIEYGHDWPVPTEVTAHARRAAANGIDISASLHRCSYAAKLVLRALINELASYPYDKTLQPEAVAITTSLIGGLASAIAEAHKQELTRTSQTRSERISELVRRLLNHEEIDMRELRYPLSAQHNCVIATDQATLTTLEATAEYLGGHLLGVPQDDGTIWAWFSFPRPVSAKAIAHRLTPSTADTFLAVSEPASGLDGFRHSHWQARLAFAAKLNTACGVALFGEIADLAPFLEHPYAARTLIALSLDPLRTNRPNDDDLIDVIDAYCVSNCNASSAGSLLKMHRKTVQSRVESAEALMGNRPLRDWRGQFEIARRLENIHVLRPLAELIPKPQ
jgi:GGDEF-like domain/PucR C-terminal helix-turn-helix domain